MASTGSRVPADRFLWSGAVSLAVGGMMAPGTAGAEVIVTPVNSGPPVTISYNGTGQFNLDTSDVLSGIGSNLISTSTNLTTGNTIAAKLPAGTTIGANLFTSSNSQSSAPLYEGTKKPSIYYVGLDVVTQNVATPSVLARAVTRAVSRFDNYGWAEIDTTGSSDIVVAYAFETTPNTPITTPAATSVPEPASLALLALGAAGVAAFRRRPA